MNAAESTYFRKGFGLKQNVEATLSADYAGQVVDLLRARDYRLTAGDLTVRLAREFGFCYGVERAIDLAYAAKKYFSDVSPHTPIYLLGEIIHNPEVNDQIRNMGIQIISPKPTDEELEGLRADGRLLCLRMGASGSSESRL